MKKHTHTKKPHPTSLGRSNSLISPILSPIPYSLPGRLQSIATDHVAVESQSLSFPLPARTGFVHRLLVIGELVFLETAGKRSCEESQGREQERQGLCVPLLHPPPSLGFLFALWAPPTLLFIQWGSQGPSRESSAPWAQGAKSARRAQHNVPLCCAILFLAWPPALLPYVSLQSFFSS